MFLFVRPKLKNGREYLTSIYIVLNENMSS